jgi:hypothetical protein
MTFYSRYDRVFRKFVPSVAKISYNPFLKICGECHREDVGATLSGIARPATKSSLHSHRIWESYIQRSYQLYLIGQPMLVNFPLSQILYMQFGCGRTRLWLWTYRETFKLNRISPRDALMKLKITPNEPGIRGMSANIVQALAGS